MPMQTPEQRLSWWRIDYLEHPDFTEPPPRLDEPHRASLLDRLAFLYGEETARQALPELERLIRVHLAHTPAELGDAEKAFDPRQWFSEKDLMLITYGDMIRERGRTGLAALEKFLEQYRRGDPLFSILHVLPFFPYSSDRGFSVVDFRNVDPALGSWEDIRRLGGVHKLMFDGVLNHASAQSRPFQEMLAGNPDYKGFAIALQSAAELTDEQRKALRRPRTSDVITPFHAIDGPLWVWTTFSPDQIDLNYRNPRVLLSAVDTLLFYVRMGADMIRLDAVTYLWKELGTSSASLEQTHAIVKLFREVLDIAAPQVVLVTETNVPHAENISYFGNGRDEAQLVYNFALPPLVLHAFYRGDSHWLSEWAAQLDYPGETTSYLNILDTHDGIGLPGVEGILPEEEIAFLVERARQHGAFVSSKTTAGGERPYELNCTWYSALNLEDTEEPRALQAQRFAASRSIALALRGVPAFYLHSLVGSRSDVRLALQTKTKRDVNRATLDCDILMRNLAQPGSKLSILSETLRRLLRARTLHSAFHPRGGQRVVAAGPEVFALLRTSPPGDEHVLCLTNVTNRKVTLKIDLGGLGLSCASWFDLIAGRGWRATNCALSVQLGPYDVLWLAPYAEIEKRVESHS